MLYELVVDTLRPGTCYQYLERLADAVAARRKYGRLAGCWTSDDDTAYSGFGSLNQVVHIWSFEDTSRRQQSLSDLGAGNIWPPQAADILVSQEVELLQPAPFMKEMEAQARWSMYELAIDTVRQGAMKAVLQAWEKGLPDRIKHGPLAGCWVSATGKSDRIIHLWGCPGLRNRERIRNQSWKPGVWPPAREHIVTQENRLLVPALFVEDSAYEVNLAGSLAATSPTYVPPPVAGKAPGL